MKKNEVNLEWDGETISQKITVPDMKISTKDLLDGLDHARNQVTQMYQQEGQLENNLKQLKGEIVSAEAFVKDREKFEDKCLEIQSDKLKHYITQISAECKTEAEKRADTLIKESPDSYTEQQKANMPYVNYQRLLATNKKIAENISSRIIKTHLFEKPVFDNPFKAEE